MLRIEIALLAALLFPLSATAGPSELFSPDVMARIEDRTTLNTQIVFHVGYYEVFFDSEVGDATWADSEEPYQIHSHDTIRIHGYLATPGFGGTYPGIVIGHGHGGKASKELALLMAAEGYVALSIDGPEAGESTGGPEDTEQAWISVEQTPNQPSPDVGFLYHYAYAGMRAITLLDDLSRLPLNPFRIDPDRFGVIGASMGGQFTYYINGVDSRIKGAVAFAVAGDWRNLFSYEGAWLYHGLYYYTRNGLISGNDFVNTVSNMCDDPTLDTFLENFDPLAYAPSQHGPLLTIIGTHDQYFTIPAINTTYERVASAGTSPRFIKRIILAPNGKHGVIDEDNLLPTVLPVLEVVRSWLEFCFDEGPAPPATPTIQRTIKGNRMVFQTRAIPGGSKIRDVKLFWATQIDTRPKTPCDFATVRLKYTRGVYRGAVKVGARPACGPEATPENILYYVSVKDSDYSISSKMYRGSTEMAFDSTFAPTIEHFPRDSFPVPPVPHCP